MSINYIQLGYDNAKAKAEAEAQKLNNNNYIPEYKGTPYTRPAEHQGNPLAFPLLICVLVLLVIFFCNIG